MPSGPQALLGSNSCNETAIPWALIEIGGILGYGGPSRKGISSSWELSTVNTELNLSFKMLVLSVLSDYYAQEM